MRAVGLKASVPDPEAPAAAVSDALRRRIVEAVAAGGGRLAFDRYMAMALYEPGLGYYSAGATRFGADGDFTTAPLMSPLFARTLAREVASILGASAGDSVLEFGAGTGVMAADLLAELAALDCLPERYLILEVSATLREEQARTLRRLVPELVSRVRWLERLPAEPIHGAVLANEVLDALPVKRFRITAGVPRELVVAAGADDRLQLDTAPAGPELLRAVAGIETAVGAPLAEGYTSEWCPGLSPWIASLADCLGRGAALLIDYGYPRPEYYHAERRAGTMMCHYRHRAHDDPFHWPGLQDITAFVDFTAVADAAVDAGLDLLGFTTQGHFLMGAGLPALIEETMATDPEAGIRLAQAAKPLMFPDELGERFKVMALGRGIEASLAGFSLVDHRARLVAPA